MDIQTITQHISALAQKGPGAPGEVSEADRLALVNACVKLRDAFENPLDKLLRVSWAPYDTAALRLGVDMGLFDTATQSGKPLTVQEFAEKRNLDPALVRRILRLLAHLCIFTETAVDTYVGTPIAAAYATPSPLKSPIIHLANAAGAVAGLPEYFAQNGYKNPSDVLDGPWQFTHQKGELFWEWMAKRPAYQEAFNTTMQVQKMIREHEWYEFFPVEEKLKLGGEEGKGRVVLADIGGGWGHDIKRFHDAFPALSGSLVLVDRPAVVDTAKDLPPAITPVGHDFFQPHPSAVRGAKAFYLRMVLHDWPDKQAKTILSNVKAAMAPDSILLINDIVLPEQGVNYFDSVLDLHMMAQLAAGERTEKEWCALLEAEGFEVRKIWRAEKEARVRLGLIEAVVGS